MKTQTLFILLATLFILFSCDSSEETEKEPTDIALNKKSTKVIESNNLFGFNFFEEVVESDDADKNIMVSPLSVSQALSMALNGAQENTLAEMKDVLAFNDLEINEINASNFAITNALIDHDPKVELSVANSIWYRNDFSPNSDFIDINETYYNAEVSDYDPSKPDEAKDAMNNWVDKNTNGKIEEIIDNVSSDAMLFLINAVYFKAEWKTKFEESATIPATFTLDNGTQKQVETMIGEVTFNISDYNNFSVIKLPYGYGKFNMVIFLPNENYTTADIVGDIENVDFDALSQDSTTSDLWLPKFEFSYDRKLNSDLIAMGMEDAFSPQDANFKSISDLDLYISNVKHKSYIKTDEEGSEAAAATSVEFEFNCASPNDAIKINRSFLFAIVEDDTNSILFVGRVYDPTLSGE